MLPEQSAHNEDYDRKPKHQGTEYVGAPTEYADEAEVPEVVGLIAKIVAGGAISSAYISGIMILFGVTCVLCLAAFVIVGLLGR